MLRGYFDGDGGFHVVRVINHRKLRWHLVAAPPILREVQRTLIRECRVRRLPLYPAGKSKVVSMLMYSGNRQVRRIVEYLYSGATVYLSRKRKLAESVLGTF
jgi:hypothetical protein